VGGHCIAIDPWFMVEKSSKTKLITLSREINDFMPIHVIKLAKDLLREVTNPRITILGMAYKANVDDTRESPAFKIARVAESEGMEVTFHDPLIEDDDRNEEDLDVATEGRDLLIIVTDHTVFRDLDPSMFSMRNKNLIDTRNLLDVENWKKAGFHVHVLGSKN
jgi:UDP-N-acetyl-D-mannosaminuronic acid dehydrogenase